MRKIEEKIVISELKAEIEAMRIGHSRMVYRIDVLIKKAMEHEACFPDGFLDVLSMTICDPPVVPCSDQ